MDELAGVYTWEPQGYVNQFHEHSKLVRVVIELLFGIFIWRVAMSLEKRAFHALFLSLLLLGGTLNQFVDRAFFDPYKKGEYEDAFLILTIIAAVVFAALWNRPKAIHN